MKPKKIFIAICLCLIIISGYGQVAISDGANPDPDPASILDLQSSSKGFLIPRMSQAEKDAIPSPPTGLMVFQTDGTAGFYYNSGTPALPDWIMITDEDSPGSGGGYWSLKEGNIYYSSGYVGIGTDTPGTDFVVQGPGWFQDSIAIDGGPGHLYINGTTGTEPSIRFSHENDIAFKLRYRLAGGAFGDDYLMLSSDISPDIWGVTSYGRVRQDYKGNFQAHLIYSTAPRSALFIDNTNALAEARAINATISNSSANESSVGIAGFNAGDGSAIYGGNTGHGNFGFIGTQEYGVFGQNDNNNWAALGTANAAVYGSMGDGITAQVLADGDFAIKGRGVYDLSQEGSGYAYNATIGGVLGHNPAGSPYSFGVAGYTATANEKRSGAVFGSFYDASEWGCLAYRASGAGNRYGGYFTSTELSGGDNATSVTFANVGIGAWGGLMGANINGEVYGLYARGTDYSIYARGDVYRTGADIHIQENTGGANTVLYTLVTTDMVIQTYGVGQLEKGKSNIVFDQAFSEAVSTEEPVVVTITPIGKSNGVYLDEVDAMGFSVAENGNGKSNVQFSWIAIGKRKGFEDKVLPEDVIAKDYNDKIQRGLVNDNDPDASSEGIYYRDGKLYNGQIQENRTGTPVIQDIPLKAKQPLKSEVADGNEMDKGSN